MATLILSTLVTSVPVVLVSRDVVIALGRPTVGQGIEHATTNTSIA